MNSLKTFILLSLLTAIFMYVGHLLGGSRGMWTGLLLAAASNFFTYFFSDKLVLMQYGAKEADSQQYHKLYAMVDRLSKKANIPNPKLYVLDMPQPNAFATGRSPSHASVAVSPSILRLLSERELEAVLAHELGHVKNYDILISSIAATVAGALGYLTHFAYMFGGSRRDEGEGRGGNPIAILALVIITPIIATLIHLAISRTREFAADQFAARLTGAPQDLISALQKIHHGNSSSGGHGDGESHNATAHLFIINPFEGGFLKDLFSTHPALEARIEALQNISV